MNAAEIIARLRLERHPEGGWYRQTFADTGDGARALSTAIYYLLEKGDRSHWHRIDAAEIWHFYAGAPLSLGISDGTLADHFVLGPDLASGQVPQIIVPKSQWQSATSVGDWTLVGCTVAPGFEFNNFEMAPTDWQPGQKLD